MKKVHFLIALLVTMTSSITVSQNEEFSGLINFTKWVDKGKDNVVRIKELQNVNEFKLNENGNFSFLIRLPHSNNLFKAKDKRMYDQEYTITAKDNDTGNEWIVHKSNIEVGKISWLEIKPIYGNVSLTCSYSKIDEKASLSYNLNSPITPYNQHLNCYLDSLQIEKFSKINDEMRKKFKEAKTIKISAIQNYDYISKFELPYYDIAKSIVEYAGLELIMDENIEPDLELIIIANGTSVKGMSNMKNQAGRFHDVVTRPKVGIRGSAILKSRKDAFYAMGFDWEKKFYPLEFVRGAGYNLMHSLGQISGGYSTMFYRNSFLEVISELLINALELNPIELYVHMSKDERNNVSFEAIKLLGELKDNSAFDEIINLINNGSIYNRRAAVYALGQLDSQESREKLMNLLNSRDYYMLDYAIDGLSSHHYDKEFINAIIPLLDNNNTGIATKVASILGTSGYDEVYNPLVAKLNVLNNPHNNSVTRSCIEALGNIGNKNAIQHLVPLVKKSRFRKKASEALTKLTGQSFGENYKSWNSWWNDNKSNYHPLE